MYPKTRSVESPKLCCSGVYNAFGSVTVEVKTCGGVKTEKRVKLRH